MKKHKNPARLSVPEMPKNKIRGVVGVKSNDGHDAPILVVADGLKRGGIEVIFLGYDLTAEQIAAAAVQEGVQFVGISSYNGAHAQYLRDTMDRLKAKGHPHIHIIGGGGATITRSDIQVMEAEGGIDKIFRKGEGHLAVPYIHEHYDFSVTPKNPEELLPSLLAGDHATIAGFLNLAEELAWLNAFLQQIRNQVDLRGRGEINQLLDKIVEESGLTGREILRLSEQYGTCLELVSEAATEYGHQPTTTYGITGRGGSGKSTLTDELVLRYFRDPRNERRKLAIIAIDPSSPQTGGAFLADRVAYNCYSTDNDHVPQERIFIRSVASRGQTDLLKSAVPDMIKIFQAAGYDVIVETYGTGQADTTIVDIVQYPIFVTTPDFGAREQLEKEAVLDVQSALVVLNKNDLPQAAGARGILRRKVDPSRLFFTSAKQNRDCGVDGLYRAITQHHDGG